MANVVRTRWEEGTLGGVFGGMAKVAEGQHQAPTKPIVTVENSPSTGNSNLDSALAQSNADEQSRYDTLTGHVDELSKPAYMRNGDISPALENAIVQFRLDAMQQQLAQQRQDGIMQPFDNPVTGNPDEPAFLRSRSFNPTGRDVSGAPDVNPDTPVQQALARSLSEDNSIESQLADTMAKGDQGKTPQEDFVTGEWLRWDQRRPMTEQNGIEQGVTRDGSYNEILPESRGLGYNNQINMPGQPGNGINNSYVPPVTQSRQTADKSLDTESTRDPRSPVAQSIAQAGTESDSIFGQLKSLRVTKKGKPFSSIKEAQLASRKTETPIALPTGGFGVVDKAELEQAQAKFDHAIQLHQANQPVDVNDKTESHGVSDTILSAFPDMQLSNEGYIGLNPFSTNERNELERAGLIEDVTDADGHTYKGVDPEKLWELRKSRQAEISSKKSEVSIEERNRGIENRARSYDRAASEQESLGDLGDQELAKQYRKKAQEIRSLKTDAATQATINQPELKRDGNGDPVVAQNQPDFNVNESSNGQATADQLSVPPTSDTVATNESLTGGQSDNTNVNIIEHTTGKNKIIRGVVRKDLTVDEAKAIDPFTFKKDGGYFIREKHLDKLPPVKASTEPAKVESQPEPEVTTATNEILSTADGKPAENVQEQSVKPSKEQFADNKLFTADKVAAARARLKSKMGNLNSGLDPEIMIDGMTIAGAYIESGVRSFTAYAKAMTDDFGDSIKPFLLSFWEGARHYPGLDTEGMTSVAESAKLHTELNSTKAAEPAPAKDNQPTSKQKPSNGDTKLKQDWGVESIDGYSDSRDRETGNDLKDSYLKDATKYLQAVESELARVGFEPHLDHKGKPQRPVTKNEGGPAVSGDVSLTLKNNETGVNVYVTISDGVKGIAKTTPSGISLMYRVSKKPDDIFAHDGRNIWSRPDLSAAELAAILNTEAERLSPSTTGTSNGIESNNEQGIPPADRAGVPSSDSQRGTSTQSDAPKTNSGNLEANQSEDVSKTENAGDRGEAGLRSSRENVGGNGQADRSGLSSDGRQGTSGKGQSDAGTGGKRANVRNPDVVKQPETVSPANPGPGNFHISDPLSIAGGTPIARFNKNKAAIELYNQLRDEGRLPTKEEQAVLAGYTGWGSFGQELFQGTWGMKRPKVGWEERDSWLRDQLGQEEWEGLQRSITNAHYTDPPTVTAMWDMVQRMGFKGGRVLEPSMGIGNFFGLMPEALKNRSQLAGIELDPVTGGMAQMLYPDANINVMGYQESKTPDNFYDLVIGNWPFENTVIADRRYNRLSPYLHDYFFLKAIDQVRPGGIVMGITSKGTMDKISTGIRTELAKKAELVASFRLPSGAFEDYAGTSVVTDIIILRKRAEPIGLVANEGWIQSADYKTPQGEKVSLNEYYHAHPDHVIGTVEYGHGTTFKRPGMIVTRPGDMKAQLQRIIDLVPKDALKEDVRGKQISYITNHTSDREGALIKSDKGFFVVQGEYLAPAQEIAKYSLKDEKKTKAREDQFSRLIDIRKAYGDLIALERSDDQTAANKARKALNKLYADFTKQHGNLSDSFGLGYLKKINDPFYPAIASLEVKDGDSYRPATILTRSTIRPQRSIENPTISDAYILSRNQSIDPSLKDIAALANKPEAEVKAELLKSGAAFELPNGDITPSDMYLAGNVREKLRQAIAAKEQGNTAMDRNIEALRKVVPEDVPYFKIEVQLGASWIPTSVYEDYITHMLGMNGKDGIAVTYSFGRWKVDIDTRLNNRSETKTGFGTAVYPFSKLVNAALSNQAVTIRRSNPDGSTYVAEEETQEVNNKISEIRQKFGEWLWSDPERRITAETEYNEARNAYATPNYDGSFMTFEGMALSLGRGKFDLRKHQVNAIWRALVTRKSLNAHEVGTGKTFTMGGIAVESRRYGIAKKPMILAHNANSKSVAAEIQQMYPAAKVLYIDNLAADKVSTRLRQIANDDWDAIVVPHSLISRMTMKEETLMAMAQEEIDAIMDEAYSAAKEDGVTITEEMLKDDKELAKLRSQTAKDLVKTRNKIIENIKKQSQQSSKENAIAFEDLGVDMLMVDEAHEFKKPPIATRMSMKGVNKETSNRSIALMFLTRYIRSMNNGGNVHLFTGTPVTNTLTEVFHQMRYIMNEEMKDAAVDQWDGWFGSFAKEVMDVELNAAGEYEAVTRLAGFINVPELRRMIGQYMDVVYADDMPEMQPRKTKSGKTMSDELTEVEKQELLNGRTEDAKDRPYKKILNETSDLTDKQKVAFRQIQEYAKSWREMKGKERREAMRRGDPESPIIYENLAAKVSFDARLLHAESLAGMEGKVPDEPNSKASKVIANVLEIYHSDPRATQVIFTQQGLSKTATRKVGPVGEKTDQTYKVFSTIYDMIERMVQQGIPREEIALVDGSTSKDKRKEIADAMNNSKIRVVIGSSQSLGVGVNMQKNLRAMHHMDAPWMPGDLEQRNGRGHRQGNQWNTVLEYRYLTDRIDGRRWQVLAVKHKFITAFLRGSDEARVIEGDAASDEENDILQSFSEAAGDPRVLIRTKLKKKLDQVKMRERLHGKGIADARSQVRKLTGEISLAKDSLSDLMANKVEQKAAKAVADNAGKNFSITFNKQRFNERKEANDALILYYSEKMSGESGARPVGEYAGYPLEMDWARYEKEPSLYINIDGTKIKAKPSIASLESTLRNFAGTVEAKQKLIADKEQSLERAKQVSQQPFHQASELKSLESQLDDLEADLQNNPVAPPAWLRAGAPIESQVYWNGKPYEVTGHRWSDEGWFVLAQKNNETIELPYNEVKDNQGMPLYDEREFEAPEVVQKTNDDEAKLSKVPLNEAEQAGKGMKPSEAMLAAKEWLRQFKTDIGVKVARNQAEFNQMLEDMGQSAVNADEVANAAYLPESKTLLLNASAIQNPARLRQLMRHEILGHHGLEYVIGKGAVNDILQILKNGYATSKAIRDAVDTVAANYADADVKTKIKEAFAHYAENRPVDQGPLGRLWDRVVSAVKSALVKAGFIRVNEAEKQLDSILKTIAENMRQGRSDNGPNGGTGNKAYFSKGKNGDTSAYGQASSLLKESGSSLVNWLKQQRGRGLGTLTDLQIDQIYRDITGGAVNRYQKLRSKMESDRNDILLEAETKYDPMWEAMPEKEKAALSQLMHDATMSRLHPDKSLEENSLYQEVKDKLAKARTEKTKAEYQAELDIIRDNYRNLSERYRLSSKQSKELYATMRDLYSAQWEKLRDAISQRIEDQIGEGGKALASQMRLRMEQALRHGPYFPLARFGDYVVKARKDGEYIREHFEKRKDAEAALNQYRRDGYKAVMTVKETSAGDQANAHALGMEVIEALDKAQAEGTAPAELKDTVWQAMLDMLPDSSYAKHAIHRKRIKGASRDGHRAYLQSVYHFAHHVSKIRYGHQMKAELDGMKEQVQLAVQGEESNIKPDEAEIAQQVLNEMNLRHEMNMNPKGSALAGQLGNFGFMFYLGASPASAMVNLTQNVTVMLPQLAGKYGFVKAAKFMLQAMVDYMRHGVFQKGTKEAWVSLTRATNAAITADEKVMLNKLYKAGVLDLTQAHSIAARADTDQQNIKPGKQWARTGMRWAGALFHNAEVLNREVAALTAYRLMKAQQPGIASDVLKLDSAAIDQVAEMVYDGHGNYAASNRPRYMRSDVMKVLTQFKIYSQMMTYTLARNAVLAAKGDKTALKTLGAMFGTTWMMAGMMGMPTPVGLILYGLASLFDDDDDRTGEASFRLGLTEVFGAEVGELIAKGPVDAISGLNISGRTGLSDLWWRSPKEGTEGDDLTFHYVQQIAGPVLGIGVSAVRGMREFANGDIQRGVEAMSPKAVKDLAKAYRQATEGEQTRNGDSVIDDVGAWNVAMQAMGFSSAKMSQVYAARGYIKGKEKVIEDERSNLLADFFDAKRSGDEEAMRDVMERIKAFNSKHDRAETITGRTLMQSIKSRNRSMERTQAGVYLSKKREYLRGEGAFLDDDDE